MTVKIFGGDIDIPDNGEVDILTQLREISKYLPFASELKAINIGKLTQKDAYRIRLWGLYDTEPAEVSWEDD